MDTRPESTVFALGRRPRRGRWRALFACWGVLVGGCGPAVSDEELGRVVFELPKIPEAGAPLVLPEQPDAEPDRAEK